MKVCIISNLYPPYHRGGAEKVVLNTIAGLRARGFDVVVITAAPRSAQYRADMPTMEDGVRIYRFFPRNLFFYGDDFRHFACARFFWHIFDVFSIHSYFVIKRILERERPDVVHTHNLKGIGYLTPLLLRRKRIRHIHTLHDVQLVTPSGIIIKYHEHNFPNNFFLTRLYERLNRYLFGSPTVVISPSKFLIDFYCARNFFARSRRIILPNPIDHILSAPHQFAQDTAVVRVAYLGQIEEHKGVLLLIRAWLKMLERDARASAWRLTIVGNGSKFESARVLAESCAQISLRGRVERDEIASILNNTDIVVVPSLCYENSPTVIFESFAFGVPVLASAIEGIAELIQDKANGLTFTAGNADELIHGLEWFSDNRGRWVEMSASARASLKYLDLASYLDKLVNLCYSIKS